MKANGKLRWLPLWLGTAMAFIGWGGRGLADAGDENWDAEFGSPGIDGYGVGAMAVAEAGVYLGGSFTSIDGVSATNVAKWDGRTWSPLGPGLGMGIVDGPLALVSARGLLYAGGYFTNAGSLGMVNVASWNGTNWSSMGSGIPGLVFALATDGSNVFVGGSFTSAGGVTATNIARWDGQQWWRMADGVAGAVDAVAVGTGGVYAGGAFTNASGAIAVHIARWDGTNWWDLGTGIPGRVRAIAVKGSEVYAGGDPFRLDAFTSVYLSRWDGSTWTPIGTADMALGGGVSSLAVVGNDLYVGGGFVQIESTWTSRISRWDGERWWPLGSGVGGNPYVADGRGVSVMASCGADLFVGGYFQFAGGHRSTNIALWHIPHSLSIRQTGTQLSLSWPATGTNFVLEAKGDASVTNWGEVAPPPVILNNECIVTNAITGDQRLYRLRRK